MNIYTRKYRGFPNAKTVAATGSQQGMQIWIFIVALPTISNKNNEALNPIVVSMFFSIPSKPYMPILVVSMILSSKLINSSFHVLFHSVIPPTGRQLNGVPGSLGFRV